MEGKNTGLRFYRWKDEVIAAGLLLVEEAGGTVTDFSGAPVDARHPSDILAGNGTIGGLLLPYCKEA